MRYFEALLGAAMLVFAVSWSAAGVAKADPFDDHRKLMIEAIRDGDHYRIGQLLETAYVGIEDKISSQELSYLYLAAWQAEPEVVRVLLANGASTEVLTRRGASVWWPVVNGGAYSSAAPGVSMEAVRQRQYEIAKLLMAAGSFPFVIRRNTSGYGNPNGNVFHIVARRCGGGDKMEAYDARLSQRLARLLVDGPYLPVVRLFLREPSPRGLTPGALAAEVAKKKQAPLCDELSRFLDAQAK